MRTVFLDTVGLLALIDAADQWHNVAESAWAAVSRQPCRFLTTAHVLLECGNAAARTTYRGDIVALRNELSQFGNLIAPTEADDALAWDAYLRGESAQAGIVDHISFVVMRRLGIHEAFTNDRHFAAAGFTVLF
jgi:predicted nucleic acid-binding protein